MRFAYPTTSGALHVGHPRSYVTPDVIARFKRMQGFNFFFPLSFNDTVLDRITIYERITEDIKSGVKYYIPIEDAENITYPINVEYQIL